MPTPHSHTRRRRHGRYARRAFTLIEVIVMVTIMAILVTVVATTLLQRFGAAKSSLAKTGAARLNAAMQNYLIDQGLSAPPGDFDFDVLTLRPDDGGGPNGPYVDNLDNLNDPWGNPYVLRYPGEVNLTWDILSYGEDGQPGGEAANADVTN
ncbi:MAG: type II secretion system protein GspG [Phycisphaerales bacterium]|jgi:general secretion pathway protein G|nr:type II secretion system protein GspG [Phycisphaerales bacterium]